MLRRFASALALSTLALSALACGGKGEGATKPDDVAIAKSTKSRDLAPAVDASAKTALANGNAAFAQDMYRTIGNDAEFVGKNTFFSPYSISLALAMTYAGARGTTATEMARTLHFDLPSAELHAAFDDLDLALAARGEGKEAADGKSFRLRVVNSMWGAPQMKFEAPFLDTLAVDYGTGVRLTDFVANPETARGAINGWVEDQTETRIKELLPRGSITEATRMVLVNAIYFNGAWAHPFAEKGTKVRPFTTLLGTTVDADAMSLSAELSYAKGDGYEVVVLPYQDERLAMTIIVPSAGMFAAYDAAFTADGLAKAEASAKHKQVNLTFPKFKIEGPSVKMKDMLSKLGMPTAFTGAADFSGVTTSDRLSISDVIHKAFVAVDEKGTEAAAATAVISVGTSAPIDPPVELDVDRPFLFFVRDLPTNTTLFAGRIVNPKE